FRTRTFGMWSSLVASFLAVCVVLLPLSLAQAQDRPPLPPARGGEVHGSIYVDFGTPSKYTEKADPGNLVFLAGFPVSLEDKAGRTIDTTRTDASGRFRFHRQLPGSYRLNWDAPGWETPPSTLASIQIDDETENLPPTSVKPLKKDARGQAVGVLRGRVRLA